MKRNVTLEEISDGNLYEANDMVKADCQDCKVQRLLSGNGRYGNS